MYVYVYVHVHVHVHEHEHEYEYEYVWMYIYRQVSNVRRTLIGNKIIDHSDVVGASPVVDAPTTSSF